MKTPTPTIPRANCRSLKTRALSFALTSALLLAAAGKAGTVITSSGTVAYSSLTVSSTDLINQGQPSFGSASANKTSQFDSNGSALADALILNNGSGDAGNEGSDNYPGDAQNIYILNTGAGGNAAGYNITSIKVTSGRGNSGCSRDTQFYDIAYHVVGGGWYTMTGDALATVARAGANPYAEGTKGQQVTITDSSGTIGSGVDQVRFSFKDTTPVDGSYHGACYREIDVFGTPTGAPAPPTKLAIPSVNSGANPCVGTAFSVVVQAQDAGGTAQNVTAATAVSLSRKTGTGTLGGTLSGTIAAGTNSVTLSNTYSMAESGVVLSATRTSGDNLTAADSAAFTVDAAPAAPTKLAITSVNGGFNPLAGSPFNVVVQAQDSGSVGRNVTAATAVSVSLKTGTGTLGGTLGGIIAAGTNSVTLSNTYSKAESGVVLTATRSSGDSLTAADSAAFTVDARVPSIVTIASPSSYHVSQRSSGNTGSVALAGNYTGAPERIEGRAVVMTGAANSGTSTDWQTIQASPKYSTYTGTLTNIPAGGWYQIEVRPVTNGIPDTAAVLGKIGVGDIYLTAGQSNSANWGDSPYTPADDRVSTRTSLTTPMWRQGYDPQPLADGGGGSPWSRLGDQLAAADHIPIGFICVGIGATAVSQWSLGYYNSKLKPAIQSLGPAGFRAVLWHQGESDSINNTSASSYAALLNTMIAQSRTDAGWQVPWYVAEVSFHPASTLSQEEPVCAGQRLSIYGDPKVFLGASTDPLHLEDAAGGKMGSFGVHFNAAGLTEHASQWRDILRGTASPTPQNGDFEDNQNPAISGLSALADGASHVVNISSDTDSPSVIGWRILSSNGQNAADGNNGFHNPGAGTYAGAADTLNGGVLPGMSGRHVAMLEGGSAGNFFLNSTRAMARPNCSHTLTVAIGVRDNPATFGGVRLDILAKGQSVATTTLDKAALDALRGGNCTGAFTNVSLVYQTGATVADNQPLAIRIATVGGPGTVVDFDNVRFTIVPSGYGAFQNQYWGGSADAASAQTADPDNDNIANGIEYFLGFNPTTANPLPQASTLENAGRRWSRYVVPLNPAITDTGLALQYSFDLSTWNPAATSVDGSVVNVKLAGSWTLDIAQDTHPHAFFRLFLNQIVPASP